MKHTKLQKLVEQRNIANGKALFGGITVIAGFVCVMVYTIAIVQNITDWLAYTGGLFFGTAAMLHGGKVFDHYETIVRAKTEEIRQYRKAHAIRQAKTVADIRKQSPSRRRIQRVA